MVAVDVAYGTCTIHGPSFFLVITFHQSNPFLASYSGSSKFISPILVSRDGLYHALTSSLKHADEVMSGQKRE